MRGDSSSQSLKTDEEFRQYIYSIHYKDADIQDEKREAKTALSDLLSYAREARILNLIDENTDELLYGNRYPHISNIDEDLKYPRMYRFFPDLHHRMMSETNAITFEAGGTSEHTAIGQLIKVGVRADGYPCALHEKAHHFDYYKVEHNVGFGLHDEDEATKTCSATYVTKLTPFTWDSQGCLVPFIANDPITYEKAMANTIKTLIKVERELTLYNVPEQDEDGKYIVKSPSDAKWLQLNAIKQRLSGYPYPYPVHYYSYDDQVKDFVQCRVQTQRGFVQEEGSCTIMSHKALVSSIIGPELATLHFSFMQNHDVLQYKEAIEAKRNRLRDKIDALENIESSKEKEKEKSAYRGGASSFYQPQPSWKELLRTLGIIVDRDTKIVAKHENDGLVIKIKFDDAKNTAKLCRQIEALTPGHPPMTISDGYAILSEQRCRMLCAQKRFNYDNFIHSFPKETSPEAKPKGLTSH